MTDFRKVFLLAISHRHGLDMSAFSTREACIHHLHNYVCEWWGEWSLNSSPEEFSTEMEAINCYFENQDQEWYDIQEAVIDYNTLEYLKKDDPIVTRKPPPYRVDGG